LQGGNLFRLGLLVALVAATLVAPAIARATSPSGIIPHRGGVSTSGQRTSGSRGFTDLPPTTGAMSFHSGYVMHSTNVHVVYWDPSGYAYSYATGYQSEIEQFYTDIAADAGSTSNVFGSLPQYYDNHTGHITYGISYGGALTDNSAYPSNQCDTSVVGTANPCLTDTDIYTHLNTYLGSLHEPVGYGDLYVLVLPPHVNVCFAAAGQNGSDVCSTNRFCAYHGWSAPSFTPDPNPEYI
jgi:hypothetical protein